MFTCDIMESDVLLFDVPSISMNSLKAGAHYRYPISPLSLRVWQYKSVFCDIVAS